MLMLAAVFQLVLLAGLDDAKRVDCTFSNPRYAGSCVEQVTPTGQQTPVQACQVILGCLNNSQCVKTYCNATTVRGGWTLVEPKEPKEMKR
jgi:hypothetical protein